jgi:hypothetical protein
MLRLGETDWCGRLSWGGDARANVEMAIEEVLALLEE